MAAKNRKRTKAKFRKRVKRLLAHPHPKGVAVLPAWQMPGMMYFDGTLDEEAFAIKLSYRNKSVGCLCILLPVMFVLIAMKVAETGYFQSVVNKLLTATAFLLVLALSVFLYVIFMRRRTYLLIQPDAFFLHETGWGVSRNCTIKFKRIVRIVREGRDSRFAQVAVVHDDEYTIIASTQNASGWLTGLLGAASDKPIIGNLDEMTFWSDGV